MQSIQMTLRFIFAFPSKTFPWTIFHWGQHLYFFQWHLYVLKLTFPSLSFTFLERNLCIGVTAPCSLSTLMSTWQAGRKPRGRKKAAKESFRHHTPLMKAVLFSWNIFIYSQILFTGMCSFPSSVAHCWWNPSQKLLVSLPFPRSHAVFLPIYIINFDVKASLCNCIIGNEKLCKLFWDTVFWAIFFSRLTHH